MTRRLLLASKVKILGICLECQLYPWTVMLGRKSRRVITTYELCAIFVHFSLQRWLEAISRGLVISRLDYCNSLHRKAHQRSNIARLTTCSELSLLELCCVLHARSGSKPLLKELHWLPIPQRVTFKIALLTFKTLHTKEPPYLHSLLHSYAPVMFSAFRRTISTE